MVGLPGKKPGAFRFKALLPASLSLSALYAFRYSKSIFFFDIKEKIPHRAKRYGIQNLVPLN